MCEEKEPDRFGILKHGDGHYVYDMTHGRVVGTFTNPHDAEECLTHAHAHDLESNNYYEYGIVCA